MARTCKIKFKNCFNEKLQTLMHMAAMTGDTEVARFLRSKNCLGENKDVVVSDQATGQTAVDLAIRYGNLNVADIIQRKRR